MAINRSIKFESEDNKMSEKDKRLAKIVTLREQYEKIISDDSNVEKKLEYIENVLKLMIEQKDSILIGAFGLDSDIFAENLVAMLQGREFEFAEKILGKKDWIKAIGPISYKKDMPNIFLPFFSYFSTYLDNAAKKNNNGYSLNSSRWYGAFQLYYFMSKKFWEQREDFDRLNSGNYRDNKLNEWYDIASFRFNNMCLYKAYINDDIFVNYVKSILKEVCEDKSYRVVWVKAYKFDLDLIEKLSKLKEAGFIIIISTFFDLDVAQTKLSEETSCDGMKVINKFFHYEGISTYIKV